MSILLKPFLNDCIEPALYFPECSVERDEIGCRTLFQNIPFRYKGSLQGMHLYYTNDESVIYQFSTLTDEQLVSAIFGTGAHNYEWSGNTSVQTGTHNILAYVGNPNDQFQYAGLQFVTSDLLEYATESGMDVSGVAVGDLALAMNVLLLVGNTIWVTLKECGEYHPHVQ